MPLELVKKLTSLLVLCLAAWFATPAEAQSNTMIRFRISYDRTLVGDIDVELFDQDKPVTVANFLSYVRSGAYLHTILHRASPNTGPVVLQGGGLRLANPYSTKQFTCLDFVPTNAPIVNEFTNGTMLLGDELDSPRGRIYLIKEMLEKDKPPTTEVVKHIDRCLSCLACMTTCPSGVNYMHLVDQARVRIERDYSRPLTELALRAVLALVLPRPKLFRAGMIMARLARPFAALLPASKAAATPGLLRRIKAMLALAPKSLPAPGPAVPVLINPEAIHVLTNDSC